MRNFPKPFTLLVCLLNFSLASSTPLNQQISHNKFIINSLGMRMVAIPAGEFLMGSDESLASLQKDFPLMSKRRLEDLSDEAPVHKVRITREFYMGETEVTVGQFRHFLSESGYQAESIRDGTGAYGYNLSYDPAKSVKGDQFEGRDPRYSWSNPGFS